MGAHASSPDSITLKIGQGKLIRVKSPVTTISIIDPHIATYHRRTSRLIHIRAKSIGETYIYAVNKNGKEVLQTHIIVEPDLEKLKQTLDNVLPKNKIHVEVIGDSVMLRGEVRSPVAAEDARRIAARFVGNKDKVLNFMRITSPAQINLRVRVIEMSREIIRNIGIDWEAVFNSGNTILRIGANVPKPDASSIFFFTDASATSGNFKFDAFVDLLDQEGLATVLAEPNLTVVSGETARFLAGGEFPIIVPQTQQLVTIEYKTFGVSLIFKPVLLGNNIISLTVRPEVSQISKTDEIEIQGFKIPSIVTRRAETTVQLKDGQTFAIAGLLQNNATHNIKKFPGLGDIPILGRLFSSEFFQREETELVITVTPYIVKPAAEQNFSIPTEALGSNASPKKINQSRVRFILE